MSSASFSSVAELWPKNGFDQRSEKSAEKKENSQRTPNNNNVVIKRRQGPLAPSQGQQTIF